MLKIIFDFTKYRKFSKDPINKTLVKNSKKLENQTFTAIALLYSRVYLNYKLAVLLE